LADLDLAPGDGGEGFRDLEAVEEDFGDVDLRAEPGFLLGFIRR
jgi:hypothetical protein